jgi:Lon protease-like protein
MKLIREQVSNHNTPHKDSPTLVEEVTQQCEDLALDGVDTLEKMSNMGRAGTFHGGRLAATFEMAEQGLLLYTSDTAYKSQSIIGDDFSDLDRALLDRLREAVSKELDCHVCYNTMLEPTTTACGHTFCRRCLTRVLDHASICPICRRDLHLSPSLQNQSSNSRLASLLNSLCPDLMASREISFSKEEQPGEDVLDTPLFICTLSFPNMPTFLHIFEPRYRLMIRRCYEGNRRFGMVMRNNVMAPQGDLGLTGFLEYGTLLEIVNYQLLRDGRSFLETQGVGRFRVLEHSMLDGYDVGRVERVEDVSLGEEARNEASELSTAQLQAAQYNAREPPILLTDANFPDLLPTTEIFRRCAEYVETMRTRSTPWLSSKLVSVYGDCPTDPAIFPYWFATVLPIADEEKYMLLRTTSVRERLKIVYGWISRIEGQRW